MNTIDSIAKHIVSVTGATALTVVFTWVFLHSTEIMPRYPNTAIASASMPVGSGDETRNA